jgi:hypothetical protein
MVACADGHGKPLFRRWNRQPSRLAQAGMLVQNVASPAAIGYVVRGRVMTWMGKAPCSWLQDAGW